MPCTFLLDLVSRSRVCHKQQIVLLFSSSSFLCSYPMQFKTFVSIITCFKKIMQNGLCYAFCSDSALLLLLVKHVFLFALSAEVEYSGTPIIIHGGSLPGDYVLDQFHFHWGNNETNSVGSEHLLNNKSAPMEVSSLLLL